MDYSALQVHDFLDVGQAQAESLHVVLVARVHPVELLEDALQVVLLDAYAVLEDGWYSLYVEVACYGKNEDLSLTVDINDAYTYGGNGVPMQLSLALDSPVYCSNDETVTVIFRNGNSDDEDLENTDNVHIVYIDSASQFYAFGEILISIPSQDAFPIDNTFSIYGGTKPVVEVLYASSDPNVFMSAVLESISTYYKSDKPVWDIRITEMNSSTSGVPVCENTPFTASSSDTSARSCSFRFRVRVARACPVAT